MGYQAHLFCPDDKTARTVTQVLSELEFTVETSIEPFRCSQEADGPASSYQSKPNAARIEGFRLAAM